MPSPMWTLIHGGARDETLTHAPPAIRWHDRRMSDNPSDKDMTTQGYDPEQDPDSDPAMLQSQHPDHREENRRDPAEGPDDESVTEN